MSLPALEDDVPRVKREGRKKKSEDVVSGGGFRKWRADELRMLRTRRSYERTPKIQGALMRGPVSKARCSTPNVPTSPHRHPRGSSIH